MANLLKGAVAGSPWLVVLSAVVFPLGFACLSGSGYAATQSLFEHFVIPTTQAGLDPISIGGVVSLSAAAGRTMSPVAAVTLMSASLTGTEPLALVRRVVVPLAAGLAAALAMRALI